MNHQFFKKLTQNLIKCNDHSLRFISLIFSILCENVLQNVRNYSGNESMDARIFLQMGTILNNFKHKRKKKPHSHKENGSQKEKKCLPDGAKVLSKVEKTPYMIFFFQLGGRAPRALEQ